MSLLQDVHDIHAGQQALLQVLNGIAVLQTQQAASMAEMVTLLKKVVGPEIVGIEVIPGTPVEQPT